MADTSLGRASLSVTADLSGFTSSLDTASAKVQVFGNTSITAALDANKITTATEKVTLSLEQLQAAAVSGSINAAMFKQTSAAAKLAVDQMVLLDGATLLLAKDENELQFQTAKLNTGYKELENNLLKNDAAFKNNTLLIELNTQKQKLLALENKNVIASMMSVDDQAIGYAASTKTLNAELDINARKLEIQARQMMLDTGATKALHDELVKLEEQEKALALAEDKVKGINQPVPIIEPPKVDTNTPEFVQEQINLKSETDLATKALELQARQMNVDSGATKKLHDEMVRLEQIEQKLIAAENKARGIPPPLPIKPPPIPENKNTAAYVTNAKKMSAETDILNKKLDQQARQMMIADGSAAKLAKQLSALEKAEKQLHDTEVKLGIRKPPEEKKTKDSKGGMKITDMLGIGFFTAAFTKVFDGAMALVKSIVSGVVDLGAKIIESGSKFQELDRRLSSMTGFKGLATGLQTIMKAGPSASFTALGEAATRLAALKFRPDAIQGLITNFNSLGVALGNPEKILALITDKIADMVADGGATMAALGKLSEEGIQVFEALAKSMGVSVDEAKRRVTQGLVTVTQATQAISDAANMPAMLAAAEASANSFSGIWNRVTNNIEVIFQDIGVSILKGFGLVEMGATITDFFNEISIKIEDLSPMFEKIGAFASSVTKLIMEEIAGFLNGWQTFSDDTSAEDMISSMGGMARELVNILKQVVDFLMETGKAVKKTAEDVGWWANIMGNTAQGLQNWVVDPLVTAKDAVLDVGVACTESVFGIGRYENGLVTIGNGANNAANALGVMNDKMQDLMDIEMSGSGGSFGPDSNLADLMQPASNGGGTWLTALEEEAQIAAMELEDFDRQWQKLHDEKPILLELPRWQKFLDENLSPLQTYQNEIAKLNMLLADGSAQGLQAFALGSANAIAKLKQATGLGGPQQFASAVQAGSAAEFQVRVDEMGKAKNVQEEIRQLMEAAAEVEAQQLEAAREIAEAIKNLPAAMPRPQAIAVAVNP